MDEKNRRRSRRPPGRRPLVMQRYPMLIDRVSRQLTAAPELAPLVRALDAGTDASLSVAQSARPLVLGRALGEKPAPLPARRLGEEAADRTARALAAWLGQDVVGRYPERRDRPWADTAPDDAVIGMRCRSVSRLAAGERCVIVASAHALLRRVPPVARATLPRARSRWARRFPLRRCPRCSWAWATTTRVTWTRPARSTCTATAVGRLSRAGHEPRAHRVLWRRDRPRAPHGPLHGPDHRRAHRGHRLPLPRDGPHGRDRGPRRARPLQGRAGQHQDGRRPGAHSASAPPPPRSSATSRSSTAPRRARSSTSPPTRSWSSPSRAPSSTIACVPPTNSPPPRARPA